MENITIKNMSLCGLATALIFVATLCIQIPNGINGYYNLGEGLIFTFACFLDPKLALLAAGIGSGLADIVTGYAHYFLFTLIIKGLEGYLASWLYQHTRLNVAMIFAISGVLMIIGYWLADAFINQSFAYANLSIIGNTVQAIVGCMIGFVLSKILKRILGQLNNS